MKLLKDAKDRVEFAFQFARIDMESPTFGRGDLLNLEEEFAQYNESIKETNEYLRYVPVDDLTQLTAEQSAKLNALIFGQQPSEPSDEQKKERLKRIQAKLRHLLDDITADNFIFDVVIQNPELLGRMRRDPDKWPLEIKQISNIQTKLSEPSIAKLGLTFRIHGTLVYGSHEDIFVFRLLMLLSSLSTRIFKCLNYESSLCQIYFLKRKNKRFCSSRCQMNWANRKHYRNQQIMEKAIELRKRERLSARAIVKRLKENYEVNEDDVRSWIADNDSREKQKYASVRRSKTKRRK